MFKLVGASLAGMLLLIALPPVFQRAHVEASFDAERLANVGAVERGVDAHDLTLVGVDASGVVLQWNRAAAEDTGLPSESVLGRPLSEVHPRLASHLELLEATLELARHEADPEHGLSFKQIRIERTYQEPTPMVACNPTTLQQVFLNLLRNGAQAMRERRAQGPAGGENGYEPCFELGVGHDSTMVHVTLQDNGLGMEEAVRRRVFEPFFTSREGRGGTGLGLSLSFFIVTEEHGGRLSVESRPGHGTRFVMSLPLACIVSSVQMQYLPADGSPAVVVIAPFDLAAPAD